MKQTGLYETSHKHAYFHVYFQRDVALFFLSNVRDFPENEIIKDMRLSSDHFRRVSNSELTTKRKCRVRGGMEEK